MDRIFIQIASYRDPQLKKTVEDAIRMADHPGRLVFAICNQYDDETELFTIETGRLIMQHIPYKESKGCCWARHQIQQFYDNEEYMLMIDSHMRFAKGWDTTLIEMLNSLPDKSVLTTYAPAFDPETDERVSNAWVMHVDRNHKLDIPLFATSYSNHTEPKPTFCFSAHFAFAKGSFIYDVPYDPELYFHGEEVTMACRAYTHGYNLYHPHKIIVWHEYTRNNRVKVWDDNIEWWKADVKAKERARMILNGEIPEQLGNKRTAEEYLKKLLNN